MLFDVLFDILLVDVVLKSDAFNGIEGMNAHYPSVPPPKHDS